MALVTRKTGYLLHCPRFLPGVPARVNDVIDNHIATNTVSHWSEYKRACATHLSGVVFHHLEVRADGFGEVGLVNDKKIRLGDVRSAFPGNFIAAGDIDDLDRESASSRLKQAARLSPPDSMNSTSG